MLHFWWLKHSLDKKHNTFYLTNLSEVFFPYKLKIKRYFYCFGKNKERDKY